MRTRSTSGQAAVEYIAVIAVVAIVFAIGGSFLLNGRAIAAATAAQLRRGLCIVQGHDCADPRPACSVSSSRSANDLHADIAVVRLGGGSAAVVERRSDGKVVVTLADHLDAGASVGWGASLKVGDALAAGGELRAAAIAEVGHGTTYEVADERQAAALIRLLHRPKVDPNFYTPAVRAYWRRVQAVLPRIPEPVARYDEAGVGVSASVTLGVAHLTPAANLASGGRVDLRTGNRTFYLKADVSLDGGASLKGVGGSAGASASGRVAVTVDPHGTPIDLMVLGAGDLHASPDLPALLQPIAGHLVSGRGRRWELEAHLDLTEPGRLDAVRAQLYDPARLLDTVMTQGSAQVRTYRRTQNDVELSGHLKAGIGFGAGLAHTTSTQRLVNAMEHRREGFWVPRYDCLDA
jgi:hypothetical protein